MIVIRSFILVITCLWALGTQADELRPQAATLQAVLREAYASNPEIAAADASLAAERASVRERGFLDDPHIGFTHQVNMNFMEQIQGPMDLISISQPIKFPAKYFLLARAQNAKASQADDMAKQKKLEVRTRVIADYFNLFAVDRVLALLSAQRESLREIARTAEARYATGAVPQQDEMKAHVEQTQLEKDILMVKEEQDTAQAMLSAALGQDAETSMSSESDLMPVAIPVTINAELNAPKITADLTMLTKMGVHNSEHVKVAQARVAENDALKSLAYLSYAPDFNLSYQRAIGTYYGQNAYSASVEISIPLWFFAKQSGEVSAASARVTESERQLEATKINHVAEMRSFTSKVRSNQEVLEIYQTGLIPQAESTLNSSRASYRAGRSTFVELLDSERSLYTVRIAYYRSLAQYAEQVAKLEELLGESISTLPFGDAL
jgi:cobalt-zinc-cadmium efflux system outer membrane protein